MSRCESTRGAVTKTPARSQGCADTYRQVMKKKQQSEIL